MPVGNPSTVVSLSSVWEGHTDVYLEVVWMTYRMPVLAYLQLLVLSMQSISMKQIKAEVSIMIRSFLCMALGWEMWPQTTVRH